MQPVVGVDVAKEFSVGQAFIGRNEPFGKPENLLHGEQGFERLGELLGVLEHTVVLSQSLYLKQLVNTIGVWLDI